MSSFTPPRPAHATRKSVQFELRAPTIGLETRVRLRSAGDRWIAVSDAPGREATGIGPTPRGAVVASLSWLGAATIAELLADLRLLEVSRQLREVSAR